MRVPSVRVVLAGLAAAAVFVGGSLATRAGPLGGRGAESGGTARSATAVGAPVSTASLPTLGSISDQFARLPAVAPGELVGVLDVVDTGGCSPDQVDLGTFERTFTHPDACAAPGAKYGFRGGDFPEDEVDVVDLDGRAVETVAVPSGWSFWGLTREGIVLCIDDGGATRARLRRFLGTTTRLPSCPVGRTGDGRPLFASADGRSVFDERGHRIATLAEPLHTEVRSIGDGLFAVGNELYRDGRRIASYGKGLSILGASSDGRVALLRRFETDELVVHHGGVPHVISKDLTGVSGSGVVAPDGGRILLNRDSEAAIVIDADTLRPLGRLEIVAGFVFDWRPATD
jgi:hypothetical protein